MTASPLSVNPALRGSSRFPALVRAGKRAAVAEWLLLLGLGALAAAPVPLLSFNLRIPGHAILRGMWDRSWLSACENEASPCAN